MPSVFELVPRSLRASDAPAGDSIEEHLRSVRSALGEAGAARHEIGARIAVEIGHGIAPRAANAERPEQLGALEEGAPGALQELGTRLRAVAVVDPRRDEEAVVAGPHGGKRIGD